MRQGDLKQLLAYDWPGNIRELQNVMERAVITSENGRMPIDLPSDTHTKKVIEHSALTQEISIVSDAEMQERVKHNMLTALEKCDWKLFGEDGAAVLLGLKPTTLASRIKRLGLKPPES